MGSINQSKSFTAGVYHGSLPREVTAGVYHGRSPREFTTGGSMIWLAVMGILNQSNAITMMSLLWSGALTNQNHSPWEFTTAGHHGSLPREVTMGVYCGRSPREFTVGGYCGSLPREFTVGGHRGSLPREVQWSDMLWWGHLTNQMP